MKFNPEGRKLKRIYNQSKSKLDNYFDFVKNVKELKLIKLVLEHHGIIQSAEDIAMLSKENTLQADSDNESSSSSDNQDDK